MVMIIRHAYLFWMSVYRFSPASRGAPSVLACSVWAATSSDVHISNLKSGRCSSTCISGNSGLNSGLGFLKRIEHHKTQCNHRYSSTLYKDCYGSSYSAIPHNTIHAYIHFVPAIDHDLIYTSGTAWWRRQPIVRLNLLIHL